MYTFISHASHMPQPISSTFIWSSYQYLASSTSHKYPHMMQLSTFSSCFLSLMSKYSWICYNENRCYNERRGLILADVARKCAWPVRSSSFIIVCKVQLPVYFSYLLIRAFCNEHIFLLFCYIILVMSRQNRVRKPINLDIKKEITSKWESGKMFRRTKC